MGSRHELVDVGNAYIEAFASGEAVDGDEELVVAAGKVALVLGDPSQTALVVQGELVELRAWVRTAAAMLDRRTSGGIELTEDVLDGLAAEAERGYDVEKLLAGPALADVIPVRLAVDSLGPLDVMQQERGLNRSQVLRMAADWYLEPLVGALDRGELNWVLQDAYASQREKKLKKLKLSETVRVRVDAELLRKFDRIEAYARGLGYRHVTRSLLMRRAVDTYVGLMPQSD